MLEQAADPRVMDAHCGWRAAEIFHESFVAEVLLGKRTHRGMLHRAQQFRDASEHFSDVFVGRRQQRKHFFGGDFSCFDLFDDELDLPLIRLR